MYICAIHRNTSKQKRWRTEHFHKSYFSQNIITCFQECAMEHNMKSKMRKNRKLANKIRFVPHNTYNQHIILFLFLNYFFQLQEVEYTQIYSNSSTAKLMVLKNAELFWKTNMCQKSRLNWVKHQMLKSFSRPRPIFARAILRP